MEIRPEECRMEVEAEISTCSDFAAIECGKSRREKIEEGCDFGSFAYLSATNQLSTTVNCALEIMKKFV
jgi:hypothetical protein